MIKLTDDPKERLIIALYFNSMGEATKLIDELRDEAVFYKVGLELFLYTKGEIIEYLASKNKKVFLDLKFHDIPNTASRAVSAAANYGADIINIHTQGGRQMMQKCVEELQNECSRKNLVKPLLIGVTVLTSLDDSHLLEYGINGFSATDYVLKLAGFAKECGLDGVVSSAKETKIIKENLGSDFITVTPGIRPAGADITDQN